MKVTAKMIAEKMNISAAAVSMALNDKPGVSEEVRERIMAVAEDMGYDFTKINEKKARRKSIGFIFFHKNFVFDTPFFTELATSLEYEIKEAGYKLLVHHIRNLDNLDEQIEHIRNQKYDGVILLGTIMSEEHLRHFDSIGCPMVLLDTNFPGHNVDCVIINNVDSAYMATDYLIKKRGKRPGYLHSTQFLMNFNERGAGFYQAVRHNGFPTSSVLTHDLSPSMEGAYYDMLEILKRKEDLADCYFADNDEIAIGAMRAFKEMGYRIPEDVAIVGFDNMSYSTVVDPPLTTVNVPKAYMGKMAAKRMLEIIEDENSHPIKIEINTNFIIRESV